ncbi:hypothetical protein CP520_00605 [Mesoplasma lactucae ATCC 49193]|uniref:J domain-containing protein n=1 Tax=Mesoplasma lactucae ATCC 49193 TaxID=81460 RepID=A0A291IS95_9MOLU|nr:hypothetical protein CP520_00605 [Mesoplasma lactucae ATCC 49193]
MDDNVLRYFNQYYGYFLNVNHELLERYLYNTTVSHVIEQALGKGLIGDDGYIRAALNSYTQSINGAVNEIAQRIQQDQAEQNQQFFDDLFRQFREAFEQSTNGSYSYRSSESHGYYEEKVNGKTVLQAAYTTLQVEESATDDEVKKAYRKLAKEYHPDRNPSKEAKDKMAAVNNAYDTVKKSRNMK